MTVECLNFKSVTKGQLIGFADVYLPKQDLEIYGLGLFQKNGRRWIFGPSREYEDPTTHEKKYALTLRFRNKDLQTRFGEEVIKAIEKYCSDHAIAVDSAQPIHVEQDELNIPF